MAAQQGLDGAQYELGHMLYNGTGFAQDFAEAMRWFQLAAAQGEADAMWKIGEIHDRGRGVRRSRSTAIRWYKRACVAGQGDDALRALQHLLSRRG